ncbi:MAG: VanZ family protein [Lachnoclostridium sp.]|nr:VanZ family protein [Lachnospira sp.]MCM1248571.1 VanZ family protein [Lachnoclostridium sp.]MCM1536335.1 VanZ family protein [Clostridium sp.]
MNNPKVWNTKKKRVVTVVAALFLFLLYIAIFSFSEQDGQESGGLSRYISERCVEFVNALAGRRWSEVFVEEMAVYFEHPIRKLAHFMEYACMGILVYIMWRPWKIRGRGLYLLVLIWVFVSAAGDELHQFFVPGRYGCFTDVLLDTSGGGFGVLLCSLCEKIWYKKSTPN